MTKDVESLELADCVWESFPSASKPALVASLLHRRKLDPNRPCREGAGSAGAEGAWSAYHSTVVLELREAVRRHGIALLIDLHGQSHRPATELGYLLTSSDLLQPDSQLEDNPTSVDALRHLSPSSVADIVRGESSFGAFLEGAGFACTPSPRQPRPVTEEAFALARTQGVPPPRFFAGNYTTRRYSSPRTVLIDDNPLDDSELEGLAGRVIAVQMEVEKKCRGAAQREAFACALRDAVFGFLAAHVSWCTVAASGRGAVLARESQNPGSVDAFSLRPARRARVSLSNKPRSQKRSRTTRSRPRRFLGNAPTFDGRLCL